MNSSWVGFGIRLFFVGGFGYRGHATHGDEGGKKGRTNTLEGTQ